MSNLQTIATTSNTSAAATEIRLDFTQPKTSDLLRARANEVADVAMFWGLRGKYVTADLAAELAESHTHLARMYAKLEYALQGARD